MMARKEKKVLYPTKTTLNLCMKEKTINSPSRIIPLFLLVVLVALAFGKFAVADRLAAASRAEQAAVRAEADLSALRQQTRDYEKVREEYERTLFGGADEDQAQVDRMEVLALVEDIIMPAAQVASWSALDNMMTLSLSGLTLSDTSDLIKSLLTSDIVEAVDVYTVGADKEGEDGEPVHMTEENDEGEYMPATVSMTILLTTEGGADQ